MWKKYYDLASSYKKSINELLLNQANSQESVFSERDIFPILFLFRHYLELVFKSLIIKKQKSLPKHIKHHKIKELLKEVKKLYPDFNFSCESSKFLDWIVTHDKQGYCFRYPTDLELIEHFTSANEDIAKGISLSYTSISINKIINEIEIYIQPFL